jgi:hypothetical protein
MMTPNTATKAPKKKALKKATTRTPKASLTQIRQWLQQFLVLKSEAAELTSRQNEVKDRLKAEIERQGYSDDMGHRYIDLEEPVDGVATLKREKRVSSTMNHERTEALLRKKNLWESCTTTVVVIDEDKILRALYEEDAKGKPLLRQEDVDSMFDQTITFAFIPMRPKKGRK